MKKIFTIFLAVLLSIAFIPLTGFSASFNQIYAFGDSLTDNGNLYYATFGLTPDPVHYYAGRFSNGPVWIEYLANSVGAAPLRVLAYGGATTGESVTPPGLLAQTRAFVQSSTIVPDSLVTIWAGANDFLLGGANYYQSVQNVMAAVELVVRHGATSLLVMNLPDLGTTPYLNQNGEASASGTAFSVLFNNELANQIAMFRTINPGVTVNLFDVFNAFRNILAHPGLYGFQNTTSPCPSYGRNFSNTSGYFFWDDRHPTTEAHAILARKVLSTFFPEYISHPQSVTQQPKKTSPKPQATTDTFAEEGR
jgi:phospholipase/lecithinase/hemolysin